MFGRRTLTLDVTGMTCHNCVRHVTDALPAKVTMKDVALNPDGVTQVTVVAGRGVDEEAVRAAITDAGYAVVAVH